MIKALSKFGMYKIHKKGQGFYHIFSLDKSFFLTPSSPTDAPEPENLNS